MIERDPGSTHAREGSTHAREGSTHARPGSTQARAGSTHARPGSTHARPGSTHARPGSTHARAGSTLRAKAVALATDLMQTSGRDVAFILFRRKAVILSVFLAVVTATLAYIYVTPFTYESNTQLLIRPGREDIAMDTAMVDGQTRTVSRSEENLVNTAVAILQSARLAEQVADALGTDALPAGDAAPDDDSAAALKALIRRGMALPQTLLAALKPEEHERPPATEHERIAGLVRRGLSVQPERRTNIVTVTYAADSPERAQVTLDKVVDLFLARYIEVHAPKTSTHFFEERLAALEGRLHDTQAARDRYLAEHGIAEIDSQMDAIATQINNAEIQRSNTASEIASGRARITALEVALAGQPETIVASESESAPALVERLKENLAELRLQESEMAARYSDQYRPLIELRQQVAQVEEMLESEQAQAAARSRTTTPNPGHQQIKLDLAMEKVNVDALQVREQMLADDVAAWRAKLAELTGHKGELARLTRELNAAEREFETYQDGFLRARTAMELDTDKVSNVSVVQPATYSRAPASPNVLRTLALGLFLAVFGAVGLAFGLEYVDNKVYTKEDIEKHVATSVLAVVTDKEFKKIPVPRRLNEAAAKADPGNGDKTRALARIPALMPHMAQGVSEKMFSLNRRVALLMDHSTTHMALIFAGVQAPRDNSKLVMEYAKLMAQRGRRVLLLSLGPMHYPPPMTDMPTDEEWLETMYDGFVVDPHIRQIGDSTLFVTQMGSTRAGLQALATTPQFDALLWTVRSKFDIVLVDCPPITDSTVGPRLSQMADGVILMVDAGKTRWQVIQNQMREFQMNQGNVLGVILNKRKYYIPNIIYRWL